MSDDIDSTVLETHAVPTRLWAIFTGKEGEDPPFVALFYDGDTAKEALQAKRLDGDELFFDADCVPALWTSDGFVFANHYGVNTHEELEALVNRPKGTP